MQVFFFFLACMTVCNCLSPIPIVKVSNSSNGSLSTAECHVSSDCPDDKACVQERCVEVCPGRCGSNADCRGVNHQASCYCKKGFQGDPYIGCRPECVANEDCQVTLACIRSKCENPCSPSPCSENAVCKVVRHQPICNCLPGFTGQPYFSCNRTPPPSRHELPEQSGSGDPCLPSPCVSASLVEGLLGTPPQCRPECINNHECPSNLACLDLKCQNPCPGSCAPTAECRVIKHSPLCNCPSGYTGSPFDQCFAEQPNRIQPVSQKNPCYPDPCGNFSECKVVNERTVCNCLRGYIGNPPNCRPECHVSSDCPDDKACVQENCVEVCPGRCASNADCRGVDHQAFCYCKEGFQEDPYSGCSSPLCPPGNFGSPPGCKPECNTSLECDVHKGCFNQQCQDPCPRAQCGQNAECRVINHSPICNCLPKYFGDPFERCDLKITEPRPTPKSP